MPTSPSMSYQFDNNIPFPSSIRFNPNLTFGERVFLAEMQSLSQNKKALPFSSRRFSEIFGVSHQTIMNWVKKLTDLNLIEVGVVYESHSCRQFLKTKEIN